jgi:hypothetical protein
MTVVLPALQNMFLEGLDSLESSGPVQEGIGQFVAARQSASPYSNFSLDQLGA